MSGEPLALTRRTLLAAAPAAGLLGLTPAFAQGTTAAPRVVSLDYGLSSTLLGLGAPPVGITELAGWSEWVVEPAMPSGVAELGISSEPNLEVLAALKPDLILATSWLDAQIPRLERFAPVLRLETFIWTGTPILEAAISATRAVAARIGRAPEAEAFLARMEAVFAEARARLAEREPRAVALVHFWDSRHVRISADPSLFNDVLLRIGVRNAWEASTGPWGFQTLPVEELSRVMDPEALLLVFEPVPQDVFATLDRSPLWRALPLAQPDRIRRLPPVLLFGMVNEATRFARLVVEALEAES
ncbi:iron-siderophore ABC transporter substrate-binding protein [Neomegalonema sp.]|uniref:iron-siderophore ABC transporter substrate-binding protein n=1 Tax=Neomegalonema sp. TaxID=2039713 RepID=UPI00262B62F0|nr:iron-siderophore ABC transporter substrate-binding protein [Neomegalonema sp.]MDD2867814.1 iron-siderophore ABC transporter substrate-binding protein [Neomegalonema sp.]